MRVESRKALELIVEKAHLLKSSRFAAFIENQRMSVGVPVNVTGIPETQEIYIELRENGNIEQQFPDDQDVRAFITTFRMFFQKNDQISFRWLAEHVLDDMGISENWKRAFTAARESFNEYLKERPFHSINLAGDTKTHREIIDVFLYGDISHLDPKYRPTFESWRDNPSVFALQQMDFYIILSNLLPYIEGLSYITKRELKLQQQV